MSTRVRYSAEYSFPGLLFPETTSRSIEHGDLPAAIAAAPDGDSWYAVKITAITERLFVAVGDGSEDGSIPERWLTESTSRVGFYVVGERIHVDDGQIEGDEYSILRSNIRCNSTDGYGVKTRCGNWQIASDYDDVLPPQAVTT